MKSLRNLAAALLMVALLVVPASAEFEFPEFDLGGETVYLWCWYDIGIEERIAEAEELFNVKIELPQVGWETQTDTYMSRLLAGDSEYDIWYVSHQYAIPIMKDGAFYPMDTVLPEEYFESMDPHLKTMIDNLILHDNIYAFHSMHSAMNDMSFFVWNKSLFDREGLPDLNEAYFNDEWTWELATEIAITATRDTDGDGIVDQYGFSEVFAWPFVLSHGATVVEKDETGRWVFAMNTEPALQALQQIYEWNHVHQVAEGDWFQTPFREGKRAFANMPAWMLWSLADEMDDEYGVLPYPKGPNNEYYTAPTDVLNMFYLPANSANPLAMAAIVDFLMADPDDYFYEVIENQIVGQAPDRVSAHIMEEAILNWDGQFDIVRGFAGSSILDDAMWTIISGEKTPAQAMSEIRPQMQAAIDDLLN
ncbi:MAG: extracellular solute-binding protein [Firmicutes bacterium]|nr:extracellular solute-binding protein [Bacillota bacterium]